MYPGGRLGNPVRDLTDLHYRNHQIPDIGGVLFSGQEFVAPLVPLLRAEAMASRIEAVRRVSADVPMEAPVGQPQPVGNLVLRDHAIPALQALFAILNV